MGLELKPSKKLGNRGIDDERIENIHVIADENAGAMRDRSPASA